VFSFHDTGANQTSRGGYEDAIEGGGMDAEGAGDFVTGFAFHKQALSEQTKA